MSQSANTSELEQAHVKFADLEAWFHEARTLLLFQFHWVNNIVQQFPDESCRADICFSPDKREFTSLELEYLSDDLKEKQFFAIVTLEELLSDVPNPPETVIGRTIDRYNRDNLPAVIEEIENANHAPISSGLQFQAVGKRKYFTAVEAVCSALEFISDRISCLGDLSREWQSVEVKSEKEVGDYYWRVRFLMEDLADTITPIVSNGVDVVNLFERQKIGYKAWIDQRYGSTTGGSDKNGLLFPDQEKKSSRSDQELELLSNANKWAISCLECISWISTKLEWLSEQFSDIDKVYLGVEHPTRIPKDVTIPAAKILRVFFDIDMDRYDRLCSLSYEYGKVSKVEESLQVANANGNPSIEFRGHPYITAIELVNSLNGLFLYRLNDIRLNVEGWLTADYRNEITEDWLRQDIENILTVYESVKDIDHKLITLVRSRLTIEQAGCKRWIYDRYGFPESLEKTHQPPPFIMPPAIDNGQGHQVAGDIANQIDGKKKQEQKQWYRSPFDDVPDSHRNKNGEPIGCFRGSQKQLAYAMNEDRKTFISRAERGSIFVHMHKRGDYEMFIHKTEIGRLDTIRERFNEFPTPKPQSSSKKKRDKGGKKD